eukprot:GDKH01018881.1.p1 GENE.GDKH01018881.1~~GDKH01018881.1.p1  ORF type:complete len:153 (+),score=14.32 GDKH01018881.1:128-586(+)
MYGQHMPTSYQQAPFVPGAYPPGAYAYGGSPAMHRGPDGSVDQTQYAVQPQVVSNPHPRQDVEDLAALGVPAEGFPWYTRLVSGRDINQTIESDDTGLELHSAKYADGTTVKTEIQRPQTWDQWFRTKVLCQPNFKTMERRHYNAPAILSFK